MCFFCSGIFLYTRGGGYNSICLYIHVYIIRYNTTSGQISRKINTSEKCCVEKKNLINVYIKIMVIDLRVEFSRIIMKRMTVLRWRNESWESHKFFSSVRRGRYTRINLRHFTFVCKLFKNICILNGTDEKKKKKKNRKFARGLRRVYNIIHNNIYTSTGFTVIRIYSLRAL